MKSLKLTFVNLYTDNFPYSVLIHNTLMWNYSHHLFSSSWQSYWLPTRYKLCRTISFLKYMLNCLFFYLVLYTVSAEVQGVYFFFRLEDMQWQKGLYLGKGRIRNVDNIRVVRNSMLENRSCTLWSQGKQKKEG